MIVKLVAPDGSLIRSPFRMDVLPGKGDLIRIGEKDFVVSARPIHEIVTDSPGSPTYSIAAVVIKPAKPAKPIDRI